MMQGTLSTQATYILGFIDCKFWENGERTFKKKKNQKIEPYILYVAEAILVIYPIHDHPINWSTGCTHEKQFTFEFSTFDNCMWKGFSGR